jgi:hypothetical protein
MLADVSGRLTEEYHFVLCNDVDEIVAVDPAQSDGLLPYLTAKLDDPPLPRAISPFAVEIVHTPALEPEAIARGAPVLPHRRHFRLNSNYAKPCLISAPVRFTVGGHGSDVKDVPLDPHLYLFHLRYVDDAMSRERLLARQAFSIEKNGPLDGANRGKHSWDAGTESFDRLSRLEPVGEEIAFPEFRAKMVAGRKSDGRKRWFFRNMRSSELYRLPERFTALF